MKPAWCLALPLLAFLGWGCATVSLRTTEAQSGPIPVSTLAVSQFENISRSPEAGLLVSQAVVNELRRRQLTSQLQEIRGASGSLERWSAARLGREVSAEAILTGVVTAFEYGPSAQRANAQVTPVIGVNAQLVNVKDGTIVWAGALEVGREQAATYEGVGLEEIAQRVAEEIADHLDDVVVRP